MKPLTKECIDLIQEQVKDVAFIDNGRYVNTKDIIFGMRQSLTSPEIYRAAGLTEATTLTDEELEKEAAELYPKIGTDRINHSLYNAIQNEKRAAHIKARKMGSSGWVSVEDRFPESGQCVLLYSDESGVVEGAWSKEIECFDQWRWNCICKNVTHWQPLPSPPKTDNK
jgi:hypothetical protein